MYYMQYCRADSFRKLCKEQEVGQSSDVLHAILLSYINIEEDTHGYKYRREDPRKFKLAALSI